MSLAVQTKNFVDIEEMHHVFELMHEKSEILEVHMTSALLVNGHYHLGHKNPPAAIESFARGISIIKENEKYIHYIEEKITKCGLQAQIGEVLKGYIQRSSA